MCYSCIYYRDVNEICGNYGNTYEVMEMGDEIIRLFVSLLSLLWFATKFCSMFPGISFVSYFLLSHTPPKIRATHFLSAFKEELQNTLVLFYVHVP